MLRKLLKRLTPFPIQEPAAKKHIRRNKGKEAPATTSAEQALRNIIFTNADTFYRKRSGKKSPG